MKACPYCQAKIEDDACFCLYCMTELQAKTTVDGKPHQRYGLLYTAGAVVAAVAIAVTAVLLHGQGGSLPTVPASPTTTGTAATGGTTTAATTLNGAETPATTSTTAAGGTKEPPTAPSSRTKGSTGTTPTAQHTTAGSTTTVPSTVSVTTVTNNSTVTAKITTTTTTVPTTTPSKTEVVYEYGTLNDGIFISGTKGYADDGIYVIPETIDDRPVIALGMAAIRDGITSGGPEDAYVKKIILPQTVNTIYNSTFFAMERLTDVYFSGSFVRNTATDAFLRFSTCETIPTLHCLPNCYNLNTGIALKDIALAAGWKYEPWDGVLD